MQLACNFEALQSTQHQTILVVTSPCKTLRAGQLLGFLLAGTRYTFDYTSFMFDAKHSCRFRFGVFEADPSLGEIRKAGTRIRLSAQPFQVLLLLLSHPGELLTRDEIAQELWPDGTFVDFEHGLNSAVARIREALGDTATNPRFVETLARRGYRFIAPVERIPLKVPAAALAPEPSEAFIESLPVKVAPATLFESLLATPADLPRASRRVVQTLFLLLQAMYLAFYVGALANLAEIGDLLVPLSYSHLAFAIIVLSSALLIPVRAFVFSAALFHPPAARAKLLILWRYLLPLDILWSLSPFLLLHHINFGLALACTALLVYSPFAQRSLILMGATETGPSQAASVPTP